MSELALEIEGLAKRYRGKKGVQANDGIDLTVAAGEVVGLLGHNGAGKTTLVNQLVGLVRPDRGSIRVAGVDAIAKPAEARRHASVQAQANVPITGLTPRTAISLVGRIRGGEAGAVAARTEQLLEALDLGPWADTRAEKISGGVARLTAFCMAAVAPGELLVLDEPTNDVDPLRRRALWDLIGQIANDGVGVLLVTHNVTEAERAVDRLAILDRGRVLAAGSPGELTAPLLDHLTLSLDRAPERELHWPAHLGDLEVQSRRASGRIAPDHAPAVVTWAQLAVASGAIERYSLIAPGLEDVYVQLTGRPADTEPGPQSQAA